MKKIHCAIIFLMVSSIRKLIPGTSKLSEKDFKFLGEFVARFLLEEDYYDSCPRCMSGNRKKNGHFNNIQRFICLDCGKTYNEKNMCVNYRSRMTKEFWHRFIVDMFKQSYLGFTVPFYSEINSHTSRRMYAKVIEGLEYIEDYINDNLFEIIIKEAERNIKSNS